MTTRRRPPRRRRLPGATGSVQQDSETVRQLRQRRRPRRRVGCGDQRPPPRAAGLAGRRNPRRRTRRQARNRAGRSRIGPKRGTRRARRQQGPARNPAVRRRRRPAQKAGVGRLARRGGAESGALALESLQPQRLHQPTRCGRWTRLWRLGAEIRAIDDPAACRCSGSPARLPSNKSSHQEGPPTCGNQLWWSSTPAMSKSS